MKKSSDELLYKLALTQISGVGDVLAKNLLAYCGSAELVFKTKKSQLEKIPGIGEITARTIYAEIHNKAVLERCEREIAFIEKHAIEVLFFNDQNYPQRLKYCNDSPILLFYKGNANLNAEKIISVVGTRNMTNYGSSIVENLIKDLKDSGILVVSGLAYGVDVTAHKACLNYNIPTIGVMAHGLDRIYPSVHKSVSKKMVENGGLLTDFLSETNPDRENFPKRNRIVAGMCDAIVVVESSMKGGSLITAEIGNSYNKDVFAFPGRNNDELSAGCNAFIKRNKAVMIESAADLLYNMQWEDVKPSKLKKAQIPLVLNLGKEEQVIYDFLILKTSSHIDEICSNCEISMSKAAAVLLGLEFQNVVKSLPGKIYEMR